MAKLTVLIKGAGEMASGVAHRLNLCHFNVIMTELSLPKVIRRTVSFAQAVFSKEIEIEGVTGVLVKKEPSLIKKVLADNEIAVVIDPQAAIQKIVKPDIIVDAILAKKNLGTNINDANLVIGLGPGFQACKDVHYCIETMRGHNLAKVIDDGFAQPNTGIPGDIEGFTKERVIYSPSGGIFSNKKNIGDKVSKNDIIGDINNINILAPLTGVIRGLIHSDVKCEENMKIGDVDPRNKVENCYQISDKARAVAGGVLEAIGRCYKFGIV